MSRPSTLRQQSIPSRVPALLGALKSKRLGALLGLRRRKSRPRRLARPLPHPLSPAQPRSPLRRFSKHSGPTSKDLTADVAATTTVADAADKIAVGDARAAGATVGQAAICRRQNMLRLGLLIRARVNLSRTNRPRPVMSRLFSLASR